MHKNSSQITVENLWLSAVRLVMYPLTDAVDDCGILQNSFYSAASNQIGLLTVASQHYTAHVANTELPLLLFRQCVFYLFIYCSCPHQTAASVKHCFTAAPKRLKNKFGLLLYCCLRDPQIFREFNQKMPSMSCQSAVAKVDCGKIIKPA